MKNEQMSRLPDFNDERAYVDITFKVFQLIHLSLAQLRARLTVVYIYIHTNADK